jgi:hypothetical protein
MPIQRPGKAWGCSRRRCDAAYAKPVFEPPKRIDLDLEPELLRMALGDDLRHDAADGSCGHGKSDPRISSTLTEDHRVHPDEGPRRIKERTATVARIDGSVRLDHVANRNAPDTVDLTTEGADHAGRKRMIEPEGITDCDRLLSDIEIRVLPNRYRFEKLGWDVHLEHGDVFSGLDADDSCIERLLILKRDAERASSLHNMVVRDNVPDFVPDDSRAASGRNLLFVSEEVDHDARLGHEDRALQTEVVLRSSSARAPELSGAGGAGEGSRGSALDIGGGGDVDRHARTAESPRIADRMRLLGRTLRIALSVSINCTICMMRPP